MPLNQNQDTFSEKMPKTPGMIKDPVEKLKYTYLWLELIAGQLETWCERFQKDSNSPQAENELSSIVTWLDAADLMTWLEKNHPGWAQSVKEFREEIYRGHVSTPEPNQSILASIAADVSPVNRIPSVSCFALKLRQIAKEVRGDFKAAKDPKSPVGEKERTCTIDQFIKDHCEVSVKNDGNYYTSKRTLLNRRNKEKKIKLPKPAIKWVSGQSKIYKESDLLKLWPDYCKIIPTLPTLKK